MYGEVEKIFRETLPQGKNTVTKSVKLHLPSSFALQSILHKIVLVSADWLLIDDLNN